MEFGDAAELLADWPLRQPPARDRVPDRWREILAAPDAPTRCALALSSWNADLTDAIPNFWTALTERLVDVRVAQLRDAAVLVYVARGIDGGPRAWVGWEPPPQG